MGEVSILILIGRLVLRIELALSFQRVLSTYLADSLERPKQELPT